MFKRTIMKRIGELDSLAKEYESMPVQPGAMMLPPIHLTLPLMQEANRRGKDNPLSKEIMRAISRCQDALVAWNTEGKRLADDAE